MEPAQGMLEVLLKTNERPSIDQRKVLLSSLSVLEAKSENLNTREAIRRLRAGLSGVRNLPEDILGRIFELTVFDDDGHHYSEELRTLCSASRGWREAAIGNGILWAKPPTISLSTSKVWRIEKATSRFQIYLERSGGYPLDIRVRISESTLFRGEATNATLSILFQLLQDHCERWRTAHFQLPLHRYNELLGRIQGRLPMLQSVALSTDSMECFGGLEDKAIAIDCFSKAPMLRTVSCGALSKFSPLYDVDTVITLDVPLSQLEKVKLETNQQNSLYRRLMEAQPQELKELVYGVSTIGFGDISPADATAITLPKLEKLTFCASESAGDILFHLDLLTLPSLSHLEIRGFPTGDHIFDKILALIARSGCSLKRFGITTAAGRVHILRKIFILCPDLEEFYIGAPDSTLLETLVFDATSPSPVLPKLRILTIRNADANGVDRTLDADALAAIIKSRTEPEISDRSGLAHTLEELNILTGDPELLQLQLSLLEEAYEPGSTPSANDPLPRIDALASRTREMLEANFNRWFPSVGKSLNVKMQIEMLILMSELERVDFEKESTRVFMRYGVPFLLAGTEANAEWHIPGDRLFDFRARAAKLLKKWKPYLLRDATPYYWSHYGDGLVSIQWSNSKDSCPHTTEDKAGDEVWSGILGRNLTDSSRAIVWYRNSPEFDF